MISFPKRAALRLIVLFCLILVMKAQPALTHQHPSHGTTAAEATYIANEGIVIRQGDVAVIFDPIPLSGFGVYPEPSRQQIRAMMAGEGEFAGLDVIFISHAHRDHFSAKATLALMAAQSDLHLVAPYQALEMMILDEGWDEALLSRMTVLSMLPGDDPQTISIGDVEATAVRIPHAGWPAPERAAVQNMVYRVTLDGGATVIHMGDADPRLRHFTPHSDHWQAKRTDTAFPPYWFLTSDSGRSILTDTMNVKSSIGIHVPLVLPGDLEASGQDYFSVPGETRSIKAED